MLLGFGSAASANSGITPAHAFAHGTGSPQDPYQIATPAQLMYFDQQATSSTAAYELVQSVNLQGMNWAPVANFQGTFNGQGFTISNVSISSSVTGPNGNNDEGFFGYTQSATVENLVLSQITLQNTSTSSTLIQVGALAGHFSGGRLDEEIGRAHV